MEKIPFLTKEQAEEICKTYPTPFHIYDEKGIRENARLVQKAFAWNKGYREYFAVKATPNPYILKILKEEGCGVDCSSLTELMMSDACGFSGSDIMFSSNVTPAEDYKLAYKLGAYINLDDLTHIDYLDQLTGIPETICCRFNAGGNFTISTFVMDKPQDAKYGFTREQMFEGFRKLMAKGAKHFGIHAFLASNTVTNDYYPTLARQMFQLAVDLKNETGADITFINLSGGVGIAYHPDQKANDIVEIRGLKIDKTARRVWVNGKETQFTTKEFDLLAFLAENPDHVFSKDELFRRIWNMESIGDIATVTVHIKKIREKIEFDTSKPQYIETIWGVGYRFKA